MSSGLDETALRNLRHRVVSMQLGVKLSRLRLALGAYDPTQPRVPAGNPDGGQWTDGGGADARQRARATSRARERQRLAQYSMGVLIAELRYSGGRDCVYRFDFGRVVVPGPRNFPCPREVPAAAVSHGRLLNDN
jgi:hypothetical protein